MLKFAIIVFPGTNCERDMYHAIVDELGQQAQYIWHSNNDPDALQDFDGILIPGGSSFGDVIRPGAIAKDSPIMKAVHIENAKGKLIFGVCNGFQILTQAGILPGELQSNQKFICKNTPIRIESNKSIFTKMYQPGQVVSYPIAHASGCYYCSPATLEELQQNGQILFTYQNNPNGSVADIAGITNKQGNVLGMMPHPERALTMVLGNQEGLPLFRSMIGKLGG